MSALIGKVAVIGAGTMGNGIAQTFAASGAAVTLIDIDAQALEKGLATIEGSLARFVKKEKLSADEAQAIRARIQGATKLADAGGSELVVEAVVERAEVKAAVFKELDAVCAPSAILSSNTSSISITQIAAATKRPAQVVGMHFFNPVPVMKLVEIIRALQTSDEVVATIETGNSPT